MEPNVWVICGEGESRCCRDLYTSQRRALGPNFAVVAQKQVSLASKEGAGKW
jgi:hypothetical protein